MLPFVSTFTPASPPSTGARRGGFTFLEVLFAIMILGIGFILVAAMFPAAIKQTQSTVEDSAGSAVWISTHRKFIQLAKNPIIPLPPANPKKILDKFMLASGAVQGGSIVYSFHDARLLPGVRANLWAVACGNLIVDSDRRYACVPFFRREKNYPPDPNSPTGASEVQMFFVPVHVRNKPEYDLLDVNSTSTAMSNLDPTLFNITVSAAGGGSLPIITVNSAHNLNRSLSASAPTPLTAISDDTPAGVGAYVLISDCTSTPLKNGRIYRLGAKVPQPTTPPDKLQFYIAPDSQGANDVYNGALNYTADAFIVGRGISTPPAASMFDGPPQDLGVFPAPINVQQ